MEIQVAQKIGTFLYAL